MTYEYYCEACGSITSLQKSMAEDILVEVDCEKCGKKATRIWSNMTINIPEHMKASSTLYNNDTASDFSYIKNRINKGVRPSGKEKVFY